MIPDSPRGLQDGPKRPTRRLPERAQAGDSAGALEASAPEPPRRPHEAPMMPLKALKKPLEASRKTQKALRRLPRDR
eukprot:663833-Pyramimonas_sp.AAC.1